MQRAARGIPLYAPDGQTRQESEVAHLLGEFVTIDGQDVADSGQSFELLPGCHVVEPRARGGKRGTTGNTVTKTPTLRFAIHMVSGRRYVVEYVVTERTGRGGTLEFVAEEKDSRGNFIATIRPASSEAELESCRN